MTKSGKAKMLTVAEIETALARVAAASRYPERDRAMLLLSLRAALRAQEIACLRWRHVLTADGSALSDMIDLPAAAAKRRRDRVVFMSPDLVEALEALRMAWPDRAAPDMPVIFSERRGAGMRPNGVAHWFRRAYAAAGLTGASSHSGRRTRLTELARNCQRHGGSIRDVQIIAGHNDLRTTMRYLEGCAEAQRRMMRGC